MFGEVVIPGELFTAASAMLVAGLGWCVHLLIRLDKNLAVIKARLENGEKTFNAHEKRIERLESRAARLGLLALSTALFTGCGTVAAIKAPFVTTTNIVPARVEIVSPGETNVTETAVVSADGVTNIVREVTITAPAYRTNYVTNLVTVVNPKLQGAIDTAREINSNLNPTPSAPFVNLGLAALSGVLAFVARLKTTKAARAAADAAQKNELLETVIAGVEAAKSPEVKAKISEVSTLWGNRAALHAKVKELST